MIVNSRKKRKEKKEKGADRKKLYRHVDWSKAGTHPPQRQSAPAKRVKKKSDGREVDKRSTTVKKREGPRRTFYLWEWEKSGFS